MASRATRRLGAALGALALLAPMVWLWGFTVDDALITGRVAAHIARGIGHRFNVTGPVTDAVTPLGFAYLVAPFSGGTALGALRFTKWLGALAGLWAAAEIGCRVSGGPGSVRRFAVLLPLGLCAPLAAWCVAGMETGLIVALATAALGTHRVAPLAAGLAAALRPELFPWAMALAVGKALLGPRRGRALALAIGAVAAPSLLAVLVRLAVFGHPLPLAVWAKPSDFAHGLFYAAAALIWSGAPVLVLSSMPWRAFDGEDRVVLLAAAVHVLSLVLVGGDWMPLFRLFVPVLPGIFIVAGRIAGVAPAWATTARVALASAISGALLFDKGSVGRGVLRQRLELIANAAPALSGARRVAALDVGWVGAATEADIVDLAGVTDESIARLPGGHTSKRVPPRLLETRGVDAVALLARGEVSGDYRSAPWARAVEARVANEAAGLGFAVRAVLDLRGTPERYVVLRLQTRP